LSSPSLGELLEKGLRGDPRYTPKGVIEMLNRGDAQLWVYPTGLMITKIIVYENCKRLIVFLIAGEDMASCKAQAHNDLVNFGRKHGCDAIEAHARPGLEKAMKELGWIKEQVIIRAYL
jgi:hypothetical protein